MSRYKVMVDDNFHYMDEDERTQHGIFPTPEQAITACKAIVDADLKHFYKPGMTAADFYNLYTSFGDDPFIVPVEPTDGRVEFSAWHYALEQSGLLTSKSKS